MKLTRGLEKEIKYNVKQKVKFSDHETYNFEFTNLYLNIVPKKRS